MNGRTEQGYQIIEYDGRPVFVVVPYAEYAALVDRVPGDAHDAEEIPWEIARAALERGWSLIRAWREHLGLTQADVAARMAPPITRAAYAQMEAPDARLRPGTINRIATALGVNPAQLTD